MNVPEQPLVDKIEAFLAATNINATQFGVEALNDGKLVHQLREGRQLRKETRERVESYMSRTTTEVAAKLSALDGMMSAS